MAKKADETWIFSRFSCLKSKHQDHHQGPPGRSRRWHRVHTEFDRNLGPIAAERFSCKIKRTVSLGCLLKKVLKRKKENQHILDVVTEKKSDFSLLKTKGRASFSLASRSVSDRRMLKVKLAVGSIYKTQKGHLRHNRFAYLSI